MREEEVEDIFRLASKLAWHQLAIRLEPLDECNVEMEREDYS